MTKDELVAKLHDIEWEDFEVKAAKSELLRFAVSLDCFAKKHVGFAD